VVLYFKYKKHNFLVTILIIKKSYIMKLKRLLPVFLGIAVLTIGGGVVAFAQSNTAARTALVNKDFEGFKKAIVNNAQTRSNNLTQAEFDSMSSRAITQEATQAAIKANDYEAFKKSADPRMLAKINTQEAFTSLVNSSKAMEAIKVKVDNAIKANDFGAFKSAQAEIMALREANKPAEANEANENHIRPVPTDAQLQTKFDTLVAKFKADGSLPSTNFEGKGGFGGGHGGHRGGSKGGLER
jgi:hypothetical protein